MRLKFLLAKSPREKPARVFFFFEVNHKSAFELGLGENHFFQRSSAVKRPWSLSPVNTLILIKFESRKFESLNPIEESPSLNSRIACVNPTSGWLLGANALKRPKSTRYDH